MNYRYVCILSLTNVQIQNSDSEPTALLETDVDM